MWSRNYAICVPAPRERGARQSKTGRVAATKVEGPLLPARPVRPDSHGEQRAGETS